MLCDAFCPTHSAATSQRHAPAPRQRCIFLKTNSHSSSSKSERTQAVKGRGGESSSAQTYYAHTLLPHLRPPVHRRCRVRNTNRGRGKEQSTHRDMPGMKRVNGHALPPPASCRTQQQAMTYMTASDDSTKRQAGSAQEILATCVWCGLARCGRGAAWCGVGRQAAAGVNGRASGMRMCDSANGSARRAGVCTYYYSFDYYIFRLIPIDSG